METTGIIGVIRGSYKGNIMEKKMETTIPGLGFWVKGRRFTSKFGLRCPAYFRHLPGS